MKTTIKTRTGGTALASPAASAGGQCGLNETSSTECRVIANLALVETQTTDQIRVKRFKTMKTSPVKFLGCLFFLCMLCHSVWAQLSVGSRVQVNSVGQNLNVRLTPAGNLAHPQGQGQPHGTLGTITGGPQTASLNGTAYIWWNVNFDTGPDGWVVSEGLLPVSSSKPDLVFTSGVNVSPNPIVRGNNLTVSFTIRNSGMANAAQSITRVQVKLGSNTATTTEVFHTTGSLEVGISRTENVTVPISSSVATGNYTVYVILDYNNAIGQSDTSSASDIRATTVGALVIQNPPVGTPTVTIDNPSGNTPVPNGTTSYNFSGSATAPGSTVASVKWRLNSGNWNTANGTASWNFTVQNLVVGLNVVEVQSFNAQNTSSAIASRTITREAAVGTPTVSITTPSVNQTVQNSTTSFGFAGSATAPGSTVAAVEWRVNSGNWNTANGTATWNFTVQNLVVGQNVVEVRSRNSQGTYSAIASRTITREAAVGQPTVSITTPSVNQTVPNSTTSYGFAGSATAPGSAVAAVKWRVNGSASWNTANGTAPWNFTVQNLVVGPNVVEVQSFNAQNTSSAIASRTITRESGGGTVLLPGTISYIRQINNSDMHPNFNSAAACGPASAVMILTYYNRLTARPMIGKSGQNNNYSWYVAPIDQNGNPSSTAYSYMNFQFSVGIPDPAGQINYGAHGYLIENINVGTVAYKAVQYFWKHGIWATFDGSPTEAKVRVEIDEGRPVFLSTRIFESSTVWDHIMVVRGYTPTHLTAADPWVRTDLLNRHSYNYTWDYLHYGGAQKWMIKTLTPITASGRVRATSIFPGNVREQPSTTANLAGAMRTAGELGTLVLDSTRNSTFWNAEGYTWIKVFWDRDQVIGWSAIGSSDSLWIEPASGSTPQQPPLITLQPANQSVNAGQSANFTVAASGNPAPSIQWQRSTDNGATWNNLSNDATHSGVTTTTLTVNNTTTAMNGYRFRAIASNGVTPNATSTSATLTVNPAQTAPLITLQPVNQTVTAGNAASFTVAASGNPTPSFQWQRSTDNGATWNNLNNDGTHSGVTTTTLTVNNPTTAINGYRFRAIASNGVSPNATSSSATLTVNPAQTAPLITLQPVNRTVTAGNAASFTVDASGNPNPSIQWQRSTDNGATWNNLSNDAIHSGATTKTLTVNNTTTAMNGYRFRAVASNGVAPNATSSAATLTVNPVDPPPTNDQCAGAIALVSGVSASMNTANATSTGDPTPPCQGNFGKGVWYTFTPASSGLVTISTCGSSFDTVLSVYTGTCGSLTPLPEGCKDDDGPACSTLQASVSFNGTASTTYRILVGGYDGQSGNLQVVATVIGVDTTPPLLTISSPANGATLATSLVTVNGTATDSGRGNSGVTTVTVNGVRASNDTTAGSGTASWSRSVNLVTGPNTITVVASDGAGNQVSSSISVTYTPPDTTPPAVTISSPVNGATLTTSSVTVNGTATDSARGNSGITSVTVNGVRASNDTAAGSGTASWTRSVNLVTGLNTITVVATDGAGNQVSSSIGVTYTPPDTTPPTVSISSPTAGQVFNSSPITVSGSASDPGSPSSGMALVEVRVNGGSWQTASGTASWTRSVSLVSGSNTIEARSRDNSGNNSTIASVSVTYTPPVYYTISLSASPSAGGTVSGDGTYAAGSSRTVTATANSGYSFVNWTESGSPVSSSASYNFTLNGDRSLVAHFVTNPIFTCRPSGLTNQVTQGRNATSQFFEVWNSGGGTLYYTNTVNQPWLSVSPTTGSSTGEHDPIQVSFTTATLNVGTYHALITVSSPVGTQQIPVTLTVSAPPSPPEIVSWGDNSHGQTNVPPQATNVVAISAGGFHNLALKADGGLVGWGRNDSGQASIPSVASNVTTMAAGFLHSLALRADGSIVSWGESSLGQTNVPPQAKNLIAIAAGGNFNLALKADGSVVSWGEGNFGKTTVPTTATGVVAVAAGADHSLALRADGRVVSWGWNVSGQTNVPAAATNVVAISAGLQHSLALRADGQVVAWGRNVEGQTNVPSAVTNVVAIAAGAFHSLALRTDGTIVSWGTNGFELATIPPTATNVVGIAAGWNQSLVRLGRGAPVITVQPFSRTVAHGEAVSLTVMAVGAQPLAYQWQLHGTNIPGATSNSYTRANALSQDAGAYSVLVSNSLGSVSSSEASLVVATPARPALTNPRLTGTTFKLSLPSEAGVNYVLEFKNSLNEANWTVVQTVGGTGGTIDLKDTGATGLSRLYRVRVQ